MSKTLTAMRKELGELRDEIFNLRHGGVTKDPMVVKARKAYHKVLDKVQKEANEKAKPLEAREAKLKEQYQAAVKATKIDVPERIQNELEMMCRGVDYSGKFEVMWVSPKEKFYIMRKTAGSCWAGLGMPPSYVPVKWRLMKVWGPIKERMSGLDLYEKGTVFKKEGRLPKAKKQEWIDYAKQEEA